MPEAQQQQQLHNAAPVSMVVWAVRTLSAPPFLCTGAADKPGSPAAEGNGGSGGCSPRLQLAAISVLRELVSGDGAKYVLAATAMGMTSSSGQGKEPFEVGTGEGEDDAGEFCLFCHFSFVHTFVCFFKWNKVLGLAW